MDAAAVFELERRLDRFLAGPGSIRERLVQILDPITPGIPVQVIETAEMRAVREVAWRASREFGPDLQRFCERAAGLQTWTGMVGLGDEHPLPLEPEPGEFTPIGAGVRYSIPAVGGFFTTLYCSAGDTGWTAYLRAHANDPQYVRVGREWILAPARRPCLRLLAEADHWVDFVAQFAKRTPAGLCPDWRKIASLYDGVYFSPLVVLLTQGVSFNVGASRYTTPNYLNIDTVVWCNWIFDRWRPSGVDVNE